MIFGLGRAKSVVWDFGDVRIVVKMVSFTQVRFVIYREDNFDYAPTRIRCDVTDAAMEVEELIYIA